VKLPQPGSLEQRVRAVKQRGHQRSELNDSCAWFGGPNANPEPKPPRDPCCLRQQAGLAHARLALDQNDCARAGTDTVERNADQRKFGIATANKRSGRENPAQVSESMAITWNTSRGRAMRTRVEAVRLRSCQ
jgi:hypothetical protein